MADLHIISLGAGVQSTVMALMAAKGEIGPMPDCAIFADTMWEPEGVYDHLDWLENQLPFPVYRVTAGDIRADHLSGLNTTGQRFASMPLFCNGGAGKSRRQCTMEYKIAPIRRKIRDLLGVEKGKHVPKGVKVEQWIGISTDEATRMKPIRDKWCENTWPLIDQGMSRHDCHVWFKKLRLNRELAKSACIGCPFHNDAMWRDMKLHDPESFADAVEFDHAIRLNGATLRMMDKQQYVHRSCKPLDDVDFRNLEDLGQLNFFENECTGMCGL